MKPFHISLSCLLILSLAAACTAIHFGDPNDRPQGSGNVITQNRPVNDIQRISVSGIGELVLSQGEQESLVIEAEDNVLEAIQTRVILGTLYINISFENVEPTHSVKYYLTVKKLTGLHVTGLTHVEVGDIETSSLDIKANLAGSLSLASVKADSLKISIKEAGSCEFELVQADDLVVELGAGSQCQLKGGQVNRQRINVSGGASYNASSLESATADVKVDGGGNALIWVVESLVASLHGNGVLKYYGNPNLIQDTRDDSIIESLGPRPSASGKLISNVKCALGNLWMNAIKTLIAE